MGGSGDYVVSFTMRSQILHGSTLTFPNVRYVLDTSRGTSYRTPLFETCSHACLCFKLSGPIS